MLYLFLFYINQKKFIFKNEKFAIKYFLWLQYNFSNMLKYNLYI